MKIKHKAILALTAMFAVFSASAETIVWTGAAGDYSWQTPGNWDPAQVPGAADDVWLGTSSYADGVDGGSAATSDCSQWTVAGVAKPQNYSFEVDTANKCIWLKNNRPGLILIVR